MKNTVYHDLDQNTVDARGQLKETESVKFDYPNHTGVKILLAGNSITLHGPKPEIGWHHAWGMAASAKERDYVHLLEKDVLREDPEASFCICQVSGWECLYKNGSNVHSRYASAREFDADVIVIRFIENCPKNEFDAEVFQKELDALIRYLNKDGNARVIVTTGFWRHPGDGALRAYADEHDFPCITLGDLGENPDMKALGLFEHKGVAAHPGDLGMKAIADRIGEVLLPMLRGSGKR